MAFILSVVWILASLPGLAETNTEWPDLSGSWALFQVLSDYWEVPMLGERPRHIYEIAKIRIDQNGAELTLHSTGFCLMLFDMGTSLVQISVTPEFLATTRIGPVGGKLVRQETGILLEIPLFLAINGAQLADPLDDPLPTSPDDWRVVDVDGDGKPGFTVRIKVFGLISGETYVVQRLRQEYRGVVLGEDLVQGTIVWVDEQVTLGASASFFLRSGKGRPDPNPERSFFILKRVRDGETCEELEKLFQAELRG